MIGPVPMAQWLCNPGPEHDVVVATRARVARNFETLPFPSMASRIELEECIDRIGAAIQSVPEVLEIGWNGRRSECSPRMADDLAAMRYATGDWFAAAPDPALWVDANGLASVMANEEDHIRLQVIVPGLQVESARKRARELTDRLSSGLTLAHRASLGFLTASPANVGSGVRLSAMLQLLGLRSRGRLRQVLASIAATGCTVRGVSGEGSGPRGAFVQLSSGPRAAAADGWTPDAFAPTVRYLVDEERRARNEHVSLRGAGAIEASALAAVDEVMRDDLSQAHLAEIASRIRMASAMGLGPVDLTIATRAFAYATAGGAHPAGGSSGAADAVRCAGVRGMLRERIGWEAGN